MESLVKERVQKQRPKAFFLCVLLKEKENFFIQKKDGPLCCRFQEHYETSMEVKLKSVFVSFHLLICCFYFWRWFFYFFIFGFIDITASPGSSPRSSLLTAPRECTAEPGGGGGRFTPRKKREEGRWMINAKKKKIQFTVRESRWTMPVIYHIKTAFTPTHTQSKQKIGAVFYLTFLSSWFIFLCVIRDVIQRKQKPAATKTRGSTIYSTISIASLSHFTWQLCNQKLLLSSFLFLVIVKVPCLLSLMQFSPSSFVFVFVGKNQDCLLTTCWRKAC